MTAFTKIIFRIISIFLGPLLVATGGANASSVTACVDHYPPYHEYDSMSGQWTGMNIEILRQVARKAELDLRFTGDTPFNRCLQMMKEGTVDVMAGLLKDESRAEYMELIQYRDYSNKLFLTASPDLRVSSYSDLENLQIGTLLGHKYFDRFDNENVLFTKVAVPQAENLLAMLVRRRIDAAIMSESHWLGLKKDQKETTEKVRVLDYAFESTNPVYIGLSKKGRAIAHMPQLRQAVDALRSQGAFEQVIRDELLTN